MTLRAIRYRAFSHIWAFCPMLQEQLRLSQERETRLLSLLEAEQAARQ
jgi:hypothetical protein